MPFDITNTLDWIASHCQKTGYFSKVQVGEYTSSPGDGPSVAIVMRSSRVVRLFGNGGTDEQHIIGITILKKALVSPTESLEKTFAKLVAQFASDLLSDADLGATIMSIDAGGIHGQTLAVEWGYEEIGNIMHRVAEITLPLIVHDSATVTV